MIDSESLLASLNDAQREAVTNTEGPLLILAGAGSGKTRVITARVAYLVARHLAEPQEIVAVTFTNKAAGEMKERIERLLGSSGVGARIGTFHSLCLRILRRESSRAGLPREFQVFDTADQLAVIKAILKDMGIDESQLPPRGVLARISHAKNRLVSAQDFAARALAPDTQAVARCYEEYQRRMRRQGGLDFDDLLVETLNLFEGVPEVAARYARGCRYLLVDEYQDTNHCQYRLARHLAAQHRNICVVGDENQSVYSWRGADIKNILDFERDYPDMKLIKLEQNYRSTGTILQAAGAVIANNTSRHEKTLWTKNHEGEPIQYHRARDDRDEADAIARLVASLSDTMPSGEIAVLYRTNNQSRLIEESLVQAGIRYRIIGSLRFYERKEIKDLLSYLRLIVAPQDDGSFLRAVNTPARGIGDTSLQRLSLLASEEGLTLSKAAEGAVARGLLPARTAASLRGFLDTLARLRATAGLDNDEPAAEGVDSQGPLFARAAQTRAESGESGETEGADPLPPIVPLIMELLKLTEFREHLKKAHPGDHEDRDENVDALVSAAAEYDEQSPGAGLQGFLDRSSLRSDTDDVKGDAGITLLTIHSAKGLEFSAVMLAGLEEDLFPHIRSRESGEELEEERRLCYVAITRAKQRLFLTNARRRRSFGNFVENRPSRFLDEIPRTLLRYSESAPRQEFADDGYDSGGGYRPRYGSGSSYRPQRGYSTTGAGLGAAGRGFLPRRGGASLPDAGGDDFAVGRIVTHPMFGKGRILHKEGAGDSLKLTIRFEDSGTKVIVLKHTTLVVHD